MFAQLARDKVKSALRMGLSSGALSLLISLSILILFLASWLRKSLDFRYKYVSASATNRSSAEALSDDTIHLGLSDLGNLSGQTTSLSAIPTLPQIWIAFTIGVIFIALVVIVRQLTQGKQLKSLIPGFLYSALISSLSIFAVDDLSDEAYLWADKVRYMNSSGTPGIRLWDDTLVESTVGTLQFALSAGILALAPVTIEVALLIPVLLSVFLCAWFMHITFSRVGSKIGSFVAPALVVATPNLILNTSQAFDNVIGFSLICIWASVALWTNVDRHKFLWLTVVMSILAPIVRLELIVFSLLSMAAAVQYYFSVHSLAQVRAPRNTSKWFHPALAIGVSTFGIGLFFVWRLAKFSSLFPAMISYKSFNGDVWALWMGAWTTFFAPWSLNSSVAAKLVMGFIFIAGMGLVIRHLLKYEKMATCPRISLALIPLLTLSATSAIGAGGDYFPAGYLRYLITPTLTLFFVGLFLFSRELKHGSGVGLPLAKFGALLALALPLYGNSNLVLSDFAVVELGRTTCDAMAIRALETLGEFNQEIPLIATTEINGAAFHSRARVLDLMGLMDPRLYPKESEYPAAANSLADLYKFNHFEKYSFTPSELQANLIDYVWIWGSTECRAEEKLLVPQQLEQLENDLQSRVLSVLNNPVTEFRIGNLEMYATNGFRPVTASFRFEFDRQTYAGTTFMLRRN